MRGFGWGSVRIYFVLCSLKAKGKKEGVLESDSFPQEGPKEDTVQIHTGSEPLVTRGQPSSRCKELKGEASHGALGDHEGQQAGLGRAGSPFSSQSAPSLPEPPL